MKTITSTILMLVSYLGAAACFIWVIVSFLIYLVKDEPFDWRSIWWTIGFFGLTLFFLIYSILAGARDSTRKESFTPRKNSKFQQRLEQMRKERESL